MSLEFNSVIPKTVTFNGTRICRVFMNGVQVFQNGDVLYLPAPGSSATIDLKAFIDSGTTSGCGTITIINNHIQPRITTGNLTGFNVELINSAGAEIQGNAVGGSALEVLTPLKLTNLGWIRGSGGRGGAGGAGGTGGNKNALVRKMMVSDCAFGACSFNWNATEFDGGTPGDSHIRLTWNGVWNEWYEPGAYTMTSYTNPPGQPVGIYNRGVLRCRTVITGHNNDHHDIEMELNETWAGGAGGAGGTLGGSGQFYGSAAGVGAVGVIGGNATSPNCYQQASHISSGVFDAPSDYQGGTGGTSGGGGTWGNAGSTGNVGGTGLGGGAVGGAGTAGAVGGKSIVGTGNLLAGSVQGNLNGSTAP